MHRNAFTKESSLGGYLSAVPTPFAADGAVDEEALAAFCDWQIGQHISGLVVCGTTGEAPTLSAEEQRRVIHVAVEAASGRVPVIAGAGANDTAHAVTLAREAEKAGARGILAVTPYYNRPTQEGLYRHFCAIADSVGLPVILYDVPARTGCRLGLETIMRLAELPTVMGLKDAAGDLAQPLHLRRHLGNGFRLLSGDDATALGYIAQGGDGCISVTSNVAPKLCARLHAAYTGGDVAEARAIAVVLDKLTAALFLESNPIPVKHALALMGRMSGAVRLPLTQADEETRRRVAEGLVSLGIRIRPAPEHGGGGTRGVVVALGAAGLRKRP